MTRGLSDSLLSLRSRASAIVNNFDGESPSFDITSTTSDRQTRLKLNEIVVGERIRQAVDPQKIESLAHSIRTYGFRGVLWVRLVNGGYHLVAGGRRYAACKKAGIEEVPVEVLDVTDAEVIQLELLENFQREDLNPIEETEGVLRMLEVTLDIDRDQVLGLFNWNKRQLRDKKASRENVFPTSSNSKQTAEIGDEVTLWQQVEEVFALIGKYSAESFRTSRLPLLNLPEPLIEAVRAGSLEYTKARLVGRIQDEHIQHEILEKATSEDLSYAEISQIVKQAQVEANHSNDDNPKQQFRSRTKNLFQRLNSAELDRRKAKQVDKLLSQLEELLLKLE